MPIITPPLIIAAFSLINTITFMLFGFDKLRAETGAWRISEGTLLGWALIGGTGGAYLGRAFFRHKTRKESFTASLHFIAGLQASVITAAGLWALT